MERNQDNLGNKNIFINNIEIKDIKSRPMERIGISGGDDIPLQKGPTGDILSITNCIDDRGNYLGNIICLYLIL